MDFKCAAFIVKKHLEAMNSYEHANEEDQLHLPLFQEHEITKLLNSAQPILQKEPAILELMTPAIIVGSVNGSIFDIYQILNRFGLPPVRSYCFLGNFINDGYFSLEAATFILALKVVYPRNIFILRGANEFESRAAKCGFMSEIIDMYSTKELFDQFLSIFTQLPVAAVFFNSIFCTSSGIVSGTNIEALKSIPKNNLNTDENEAISGLFLLEPSAGTYTYTKSSHMWTFGQVPFMKFMSDNRFSLLIRGKDSTNDGVSYLFDRKLISVNSSSSGKSNSCGIVAVFGKHDLKSIKLQTLPHIYRTDVAFVEVNAEAQEQQTNKFHEFTMPRVLLGSSTTRKTAMRILDTSKNSIPLGHPIHTLCNGGDKLDRISRVRTYGTSRIVPISRLENTFF